MVLSWRNQNVIFLPENWSFGVTDCPRMVSNLLKTVWRVCNRHLRLSTNGSCIGMLTYNTKFLPALSHTLYPLHQLLPKNTLWVWRSKQQKVFESWSAKRLLSQNMPLAHYDVKRPLKLYCYASAYGLGACLVHIMDDNTIVRNLLLMCPVYLQRQKWHILCSNRTRRLSISFWCLPFSPIFIGNYLHWWLITGPSGRYLAAKRAFQLWRLLEYRDGVSYWVPTNIPLNMLMVLPTSVLIACPGYPGLGNQETMQRRPMLLFRSMSHSITNC